ncbi:haloacid dehalogenase-like hydrolase [Dactylosporangium sp. NPDC005555]|uniref:HAD family hydrolase n=1 Tax=Dactylosporangium sp. NPDC005555 TaxID=3154889 RepID=UPI0033BB76F7
MSQQPVVIGFDLDMTLLDTRPGIAATYRALTARTGVHVDADLAVSRLGPPLRTEMSEWFPPSAVEEAVSIYRDLYIHHAIVPAVALPGAFEALAAVRSIGGRIVVITSKLGRLASLHLAHLDIPVDEVHGDVFAAEKASVLTAIGATAYVGDHVADMQAGALAGVPVLGVTTGPCSAADLHAAGATAVGADLHAFPAFLRRVISVGRPGSGD